MHEKNIGKTFLDTLFLVPISLKKYQNTAGWSITYVELSPQYSKFHVYTQIDIKMIKYIIYP